jgi:hypothetical protein
VISKQTRDYGDRSEFCVFTKALIRRIQGDIEDSLVIFQKLLAQSPANQTYLKGVAESLHLLGKSQAAIDIFAQSTQQVSKNKTKTKTIFFNFHSFFQ